MVVRTYDPRRPYRIAMYGRMSDPNQNPRSPDQQFATCEEVMRRRGYPWRRVAAYRDDGVSGRYVRRRPQYQRMLRDIEAGLITTDLIVVDTLERPGPATATCASASGGTPAPTSRTTSSRSARSRWATA